MMQIRYGHSQSCNGWVVVCLNRQKDQKRGGGRQWMVGGVEQGALYNDRVFTRWLIVLHRPDCGLKRHALVFAEWRTVGMSEVLSHSFMSHTRILLLYAVNVSSNHWQKQWWLTDLHFLPLYKNKAKILKICECHHLGLVMLFAAYKSPYNGSCRTWRFTPFWLQIRELILNLHWGNSPSTSRLTEHRKKVCM